MGSERSTLASLTQAYHEYTIPGGLLSGGERWRSLSRAQDGSAR